MDDAIDVNLLLPSDDPKLMKHRDDLRKRLTEHIVLIAFLSHCLTSLAEVGVLRRYLKDIYSLAVWRHLQPQRLEKELAASPSRYRKLLKKLEKHAAELSAEECERLTKQRAFVANFVDKFLAILENLPDDKVLNYQPLAFNLSIYGVFLTSSILTFYHARQNLVSIRKSSKSRSGIRFNGSGPHFHLRYLMWFYCGAFAHVFYFLQELDPLLAHYLHRSLLLLIDLSSMLMTRRFLMILMDDRHTVVRCQNCALYKSDGKKEGCLFSELVDIFSFYAQFQVDSTTGEAVDATELDRRLAHFGTRVFICF